MTYTEINLVLKRDLGNSNGFKDKHSHTVIIYRYNLGYMCYSEQQRASKLKLQERLPTEIILGTLKKEMRI